MTSKCLCKTFTSHFTICTFVRFTFKINWLCYSLCRRTRQNVLMKFHQWSQFVSSLRNSSTSSGHPKWFLNSPLSTEPPPWSMYPITAHPLEKGAWPHFAKFVDTDYSVNIMIKFTLITKIYKKISDVIYILIYGAFAI